MDEKPKEEQPSRKRRIVEIDLRDLFAIKDPKAGAASPKPEPPPDPKSPN